ncbi:MAG: UDP-N-acetylmuramoyl-L-alanine--D-glutamate ligase [SAR116 cluster bacterium MED-G06]|nr:MAG: UDP-N-acetylmuramoyl-L-alanine--D-glutamate ligase [SAR116 cluster bacterium MED-G06]
MLVPHNMSGKMVGILGLGLSGMAAARALVAGGATVWLHDDTHRPDALPAGATLCDWRDWPWDELASMVISPGIPHHHPRPHDAAARAASAGVEVISEIEIAMRAAPAARIVAITGTNGKSTTTALIGHCLRDAGIAVAVGGNIGDAACNLDDPGADGVIVLELSSYQLETTPSLRADIAILLNITPDHLVRHGGMEGYVAAKGRILAAAGTSGLVITGSEDTHVRALADAHGKAGGTIVTVSATDAPAGAKAVPALAGAHNAANAAVAAACLRHLGLDDATIEAGMAGFAGLAHRLQPVARSGDITFVNDSKATNGVATAKALAAFDNIYWIAGGEAKEDGLGEAAGATAAVTRAYLIGSAAEDFAATLASNQAGRVPVTLSGDLETATVTAFSDASAAQRKATILLSPAAASFDQFTSFVARGEAFTAIATRLASDGAAGGAMTGPITGGAHA